MAGLSESTHLLRGIANRVEKLSRQHSAVFHSLDLGKLTKVLEKLNEVRVPKQPYSTQLYLDIWQDYKDQRVQDIPTRALRYLCWEGAVSTNPVFLEYVNGLVSPLGARGLQGLVYSTHASWDQVADRSSHLRKIHRLLNSYNGRNRLVRKWKVHKDLVLFDKSPTNCADRMLGEFSSIEKFASEFGLFEQTEFFRAVVLECSHKCLKILNQVSDSEKTLEFLVEEILEWQYLDAATYKEIISHVILSAAFEKNEHVRERTAAQIIGDERLGDPRLPSNSHKWIGVDAEARKRLLNILSRADITFFFDQVMRGYDDRHGRKQFWLRYVSALKQSRPLLSGDDRIHLRSLLDRERNKMLHYGTTRGQQSAFLLDFGSILAIEFNGVGACYIYNEQNKKRLFPDIYRDASFSDAELKQPYYAEDRIRHAGNWQWKVQYILSQHGIRPS